MRWFRRRPADSPATPAPTWPPEPKAVDVEPATEPAAVPAEPVDSAPPASVATEVPPEVPQPAAASVAEPAPAVSASAPPTSWSTDLRHWHRATPDLRLPAARPPGTRSGPRVSSERWHRV